jgi:hypothetical protein
MTIKKIINSAAKLPMPDPTDATKVAFNTLVSAWKECSIISEQEQTKRENIRCNRDVNIKAIEENAAILKLYLEKTFAERGTVIHGMFDRLDKGLASGNIEVISLTIGAIVDVTKQSPLTAARELISNYHNPDVAMIEI